MPEADNAQGDVNATASEPAGGAPQTRSDPQPQPNDNTSQGAASQLNGILGNADPNSQPIADWSKVDLGLDKNTDINPDLLASFGAEVAVKLGLTPAQAKGAVEWQLGAIATAREQYRETQLQELKKAWGGKFQANGEKVMSFIASIDKKQGNDNFSRALAQIGVLDNAQAIVGLLEVARMLEEDGTGNANPDNIGSAAETAEEGIAAMYKLARQGRQ